MGVEITQDLFQRHDPTEFDPEAMDRLREEHGIVPYFCNQKWRDDRRGWGTLDPLEYKDPRFEAVYACLRNKPRNPERKVKDGYYHQGDLVLATQAVDDYEVSQMRRTYLANRRVRAIKDGDQVRGQLQGQPNTAGIETYPADFRMTDSKGNDRMPGQSAKGFTVPKPSGGKVPVMTSPKGSSGKER